MHVSRRHIWVHLMLYPGHTLPTAIAPILVAAGLALHDSVFHFWPLFVAFLCSWMVHCGGVFTDVHELITRWPNLREHPELDDALASGRLRLPTLRAATLAWFALAFVPGVYLLHVVGAKVALVLAAIGIVAAVWYSFGMARRGLADPVFFVMFAVVAPAAAYYVQALHLSTAALLVGIPTAALVNNVLAIDDMRDMEFDRTKGWRTTAVRHGLAGSRLLHVGQTLVAYAGTAVLVVAYGPWLLLPMLTLPLAIAAERAVWTSTRREQLIPWTPRSAFIAALHALLVCAGLALA